MAARARQEEFKAVVPNGEPLNIAVSALIKALRRGNELEGLYWAKQIEQGGFYKYVWRRLLIFASEDVSIANPDLVVQVRTLWLNYEQVKKDSRNPIVDRSILTMAVMLIARSPKSRECDDLLNVIEHLMNRGWQPTVRDEVLDLHTKDGKSRWPSSMRFRQWMESASHEENRIGSRDWNLWLLKWGAQRGIYEVEWVEYVATVWDAAGFLEYGVDGMNQSLFDWTNVDPEYVTRKPAAPELDKDLWPMDVFQWRCPTCRMPLPECQSQKIACCDDCEAGDGHGLRKTKVIVE